MAKQKITFNFDLKFHSKLQQLADARGITRTAVLEFLVHNAELALWENAPKSAPDIQPHKGPKARMVVGRPDPDKIADFQRRAGMAGGKVRK